jgi:tetratricopeptide (TPR) repeat protein
MSSLDARDEFKQGQKKLVPPVTQADIEEAKQLFTSARQNDPDFHRAAGWLGYAWLVGFIEGYDDSNAPATALGFAQEAVAGDPADWDNHWALAMAQLYSRQWEASDASYLQAIALDIEGSIHLRSDYGHSLIYMGRNREGARTVLRAGGRRDWHRWNIAWAYFFLARTDMAPLEDSIYLDLALDEISRMRLPTNHPRYLADAQLLTGAIHLLRNDTEAAQGAMEIFRQGKGTWTIEQELAACPFDDRNADGRANRDFWANAAGPTLQLS